MKFRFCGDLDCPEWILAEIALMAKLTSIKFKLICQNVVTDVVGKDSQISKAEKLLKDVGFDESQTKGCIAALIFIFRSTTKYDCDANNLNNELQQLGLQSELSQQLCKVYSENAVELRTCVKNCVFKTSAANANISIESVKESDGGGYCLMKYADASYAIPATMVSLMRQDIDEALKIMEKHETSFERRTAAQ